MRHALILILCILFTYSCSGLQGKPYKKRLLWSKDIPGFNPESAYYHPSSGKLYVSNVVGSPVEKDKNGHIDIYDIQGNLLVSKWVKGLNAPKGIRATKDTLWVSDIDRIIGIDIKSGKIKKNVKVKGAKFLNDVAIDDNGNIYVSDMITNKIHRLSAKGKLSTFLSSEDLECPNGLLVVGNKLYVASWGTITDPKTFGTKKPGRLFSISLINKKKEYITKLPLGNLDGLELDRDGNFIISDWVNGIVMRVDPNGRSEVLYADFEGSADIGLIPEKNILFVPEMGKSKLMAFTMPPTLKEQEEQEEIEDSTPQTNANKLEEEMGL